MLACIGYFISIPPNGYLIFQCDIETIVIKCLTFLLFSVKSLAFLLKSRIPRTKCDIRKALEQIQICPDSPNDFIGAFEFFASTPDFEDPAFNLTRKCPFSPIKGTRLSARSMAGGIYGNGLLRLVVVITAGTILLS